MLASRRRTFASSLRSFSSQLADHDACAPRGAATSSRRSRSAPRTPSSTRRRGRPRAKNATVDHAEHRDLATRSSTSAAPPRPRRRSRTQPHTNSRYTARRSVWRRVGQRDDRHRRPRQADQRGAERPEPVAVSTSPRRRRARYQHAPDERRDVGDRHEAARTRCDWAAGTDEPMMSASRIDDGIPSSELRSRARFTWSSQARRVFSLSGLLVTRAISARSSPP